MSKANIAVKAGCGCFLIVSGIIFFILKEVFNINGWLSLGIIIFSTIIIVTTSAIKVGKDEKRKKDEDDKKIVNISVKYPLAYADYLDKLGENGACPPTRDGSTHPLLSRNST